MFGWVRGGGLLSRVVEKTKAVTENIVTTLDPQMKDFIHSGGDVQVWLFEGVTKTQMFNFQRSWRNEFKNLKSLPVALMYLVLYW